MFRFLRIQLGLFFAGGVLVLGFLIAWFFGNFFYDILWAWLEGHHIRQADMIAYTLAHITPFLLAAIVVAILFFGIRYDLKRASASAQQPPLPAGASSKVDDPKKFTGFAVVDGRLIQPPSKPAGDPFSRALNVSRIWFQNPHLAKKGLIHINIDVFNGNDEQIFLKKITGAISVQLESAAAIPAKRGNLITPSFYSPRQNCFGALQAFSLILEQPIPQNLADEFLNWVDNTSYVFDFDNLNIIVRGLDSKKEARLLLWDQAKLPKNFWGRTALRVALIRPDRPLNMPTSQ